MKPNCAPTNLRLLRDPFWIIAITCYALHKCWQAVYPDSGWMDHYWNDLWMLPCALPLILSVYGLLGLRELAIRPSGAEILWHGVLWGLMAEFVGPLCFKHAVGDPWDLVAYAVGGFVLFYRWHRVELKRFSFAFRF